MNPPPAATPFTEPSWTDPLLKNLGVERGAPADEVLMRADRLAERLAPNTRRLWRWILLTEALAVLLPISWLMVSQRRWPAGMVATSVALCTLALIGFCWWLRWRNQQHVWTRSRLLAEMARSLTATAGWAGEPTRAALETAPSLQPLLGILGGPVAPPPSQSFEKLKEAYLKDRIKHQVEYYKKKAKEAALERKKLSAYVTRSLDGALVLAVLGLWLGYSRRIDWMLSVANTDLILGLAGAALPLTAIIMQSLSAYLELNRRTGRYAQQWEFLEVMEKRFAAANSQEAQAMVHEVERALLAENIEWFYQADHAEIFYRSLTSPTLTPRQQITAAPEGWWSRMVTRTLLGAGLALNVTGRIIFGRVLIIALTSVITTLLIFSRAPSDAMQLSTLRTADGQLLSGRGAFGRWNPKEDDTKRGFILIAHGLHDSVNYVEKEEKGPKSNPALPDKMHWMTELKQSIQEKLEPAGGAPDICLVDWGLAAKPSEVNELLRSLVEQVGTSDPEGSAKFVADVVAIRSQAQAIGDIVGYKLTLTLRASPPLLNKDRPMHFIGHSAGGFLVVRAALALQRQGLLPENSRITMLDTPIPDENDLNELLSPRDGKPSTCKVDYYKTSDFAKFMPPDKKWPNYQYFDVKPDIEHQSPVRRAHSYAHQWYIRTVRGKQGSQEPKGFGESPFVPR